jgi:hypothetical protein
VRQFLIVVPASREGGYPLDLVRASTLGPRSYPRYGDDLEHRLGTIGDPQRDQPRSLRSYSAM